MPTAKKTTRTRSGRTWAARSQRPGRAPGHPLHIALEFHDARRVAQGGKPLGEDLSALAIVGRTLFCAADEGATLEVLTLDDAGQRFGDHRSLALGDVFDLPEGNDGEMDIEGLAVADGWLWIVGSHSLKRPAMKDGAGLERLQHVKRDRNRCFLGRMPLVSRADGTCEAVASDGARRAGALRIRKDGSNPIRRRLAKDPLIAPFVHAPAKENGFDVEGIAVEGDRVFLGLRGPVMCGIAFLVEVRVREGGRAGLKLATLEDGSDYRLHPLPLHGLGVRDLLLHQQRLLVLAGATMALSGPQAVFALPRLPAPGALVEFDSVRRVLELPVVPGADHAEGMAILGQGREARLLVMCDSPAPRRRQGQHTVLADAFPMSSIA